MAVFVYILLFIVLAIVGTLGFFYYKGATYVPPASPSSTAKSPVTETPDSSKTISTLVPAKTESSDKSLSQKLSDKKAEFAKASKKDKAKMLLKGAALATPAGMAVYGGSKLIKKIKQRKSSSAKSETTQASTPQTTTEESE